jgi:hypothetical protein
MQLDVLGNDRVNKGQQGRLPGLSGRRRVAFQRRASPRFGREFFFWADNGQSRSYRAISRLMGTDVRRYWMTAIRNLVQSQRVFDGISDLIEGRLG